jgi:hypothetical protein
MIKEKMETYELPFCSLKTDVPDLHLWDLTDIGDLMSDGYDVQVINGTCRNSWNFPHRFTTINLFDFPPHHLMTDISNLH